MRLLCLRAIVVIRGRADLATVAAVPGPTWLLSITVVAVTFQYSTFGQRGGPRLGGQRTDLWFLGGIPDIPFLHGFDWARTLARSVRTGIVRLCGIVRRHGFTRRLAPTTPPSPPAPSSPAPAACFACRRRSGPALGFLRLFSGSFWLWFRSGFWIAQQTENPWLDPHEGAARGFLHRGSKLGLHGYLRSSPDEGEKLALRCLLGEFLEVKRPALTPKNFQGCFQKGHDVTVFTINFARGVGVFLVSKNRVFLTMPSAGVTRE
jgi:hypothetical protein